ncbi:MAG: glycosyltransferase family 4 protein [Planctomycetota bacterium]
MARPRPVRLVHPLYLSGSGISACALALAEVWDELGAPVEYWCTGAPPQLRRRFVHVPLSPARTRLHYKFRRPEEELSRGVEQALLREVGPEDVVYTWPGTSLEFARGLSKRGAFVAVERVNSHRANARRILDRLYARHDLDRRRPLLETHAHDEYDSMIETRKLELADALFSPSPFVTASLLEQGLDAERVVPTSYAWDARAFRPVARGPRREGRCVFAHVGSDVLRKGVGELLAAWRRAEGPGELRVVGDVPIPLARRWVRDLARPEVRIHSWVSDLATFFADVDVYVLASHEEGSPVSTCLALASGLPCLVSPAGSGGVVRDGVDGFVVDPDDAEGWAAALVRLAGDAELRAELGRNAKERSRELTWDVVGAKRYAAVAARVGLGGLRAAG